jgi:hypothetical protein
MFRHVCTVLPYPVQVGRIPDVGLGLGSGELELECQSSGTLPDFDYHDIKVTDFNIEHQQT